MGREVKYFCNDSTLDLPNWRFIAACYSLLRSNPGQLPIQTQGVLSFGHSDPLLRSWRAQYADYSRLNPRQRPHLDLYRDECIVRVPGGPLVLFGSISANQYYISQAVRGSLIGTEDRNANGVKSGLEHYGSSEEHPWLVRRLRLGHRHSKDCSEKNSKLHHLPQCIGDDNLHFAAGRLQILANGWRPRRSSEWSCRWPCSGHLCLPNASNNQIDCFRLSKREAYHLAHN